MDNNAIYYTYLVYGLIVKSQMPLSELTVYKTLGECKVDVTISFRKIPESIKNKINNGKKCCFEKNEIWFCIENTAIYYIKDTNAIEVEVFKGANRQNVKTFLLGSAFGMLLIIRKSIAIHGGAAVINGNGIIVTGDSGAGKSTLTAALREKNCEFLADDVTVIGEDQNNNLTIMPGYPQQKLCRDAVEKFKYYKNKSIKKIDEGRDKYSVAIENNFRKNASNLKAIYELSTSDVDKVEVHKVKGREKLYTIFKNIYRFQLVDYIGIDPIYLKKCLNVAKNIEIYKILRPKCGFTIENQIKVIENTVKGAVG
ncbi:MAG: hypothetical protein PHX70_13810 [Clostridium sp.]|nr:hypothetical protein [Clostridium sp.]